MYTSVTSHDLHLTEQENDRGKGSSRKRMAAKAILLDEVIHLDHAFFLTRDSSPKLVPTDTFHVGSIVAYYGSASRVPMISL